MYLIVIIVLLVGAFVLFQYMKKQSSGISHYFINAVRIYILGNYTEGRVAALAAAKVAAKRQRCSMIDYLTGMVSDLQRESPDDHTVKEHCNRLLQLRDEIASNDWTIKDIAEEKQRLYECNPELLAALKKADANALISLYPTLFKDKM